MTADIAYKAGDSDTRPWGRWQVLDVGERHIVKHITVNPGQVLSLQYHHHRSEHWVIVRGVATVTLGDDVFERRENESVYIPVGAYHRVSNQAAEVLEFVEIQTGIVLREDDIVRVEDHYGRS